jgi:protein-tyrosine-phosphatase/DNA-binding transcriptional ArsR family regulator
VVRTLEAERGADDPPPVLPLIGHPVRWRLLRELTRSDRTVRELSDLVGERQSLVSYHLAQLGGAGLVRSRRSSADGRDSYYAIDLPVCEELLRTAGGSLHPGLRFATAPTIVRAHTRRSRRRQRVLFLCTGNSARSQMAEALLGHLSHGAVDAASAGSNPKPLHPNAVRVMNKRGIDISANRTKHVDEFVAQRFDCVISLCDRVREVCPEFPCHPDLVHWSIPDPALAGPNHRATYPAFERLASELETRITFLLLCFDERPTRRSMDAKR